MLRINKVIYHLRVYETRLEERQAFRPPLDSLFINFIELENKIDDLSLLDLTKNVEIIFSKYQKTDYPLAKLSLEVGKEVNIPIEIFDGENQIVIKNLKLLNSAEDSEMKEFFKNDIVFPYVSIRVTMKSQ